MNVPEANTTGRRVTLALALAVGTITAAAFAPVLRNGFIAMDDPQYVTENPFVQEGLTPSALAWALTTNHADNWHPLTWISHMVDWRLFGAAAWGHHLTSLLLHVASAVILFAALRRMTGAPLESALVATLFGVHPLHVESVAWVAERKDVLSTLFWMLVLLAYGRRAGKDGAWRLLPVALLLAAGLASKPMLVSLPVVLLLLDFWPLRRTGRDSLRARLVEKVPLFALAAVSAGLTLWAQERGGAIADLGRYSAGARVANALRSYLAYLADTFWPTGLAFYYPHPGEALGPGHVAAFGAVLAVLTWGALRLRRRAPYVVVGWAWYLTTLIPVIGLVQVGWQARADRYTYVPLVGIFIAVVWGLRDLAGLATRARGAVGAGPARWGLLPVALAVPVLCGLTWNQLGYWKDSRTLFERSLEVTGDNATVLWVLGNVAAGEGRTDEALAHYREALRIQPRFPEVHHNLAVLLESRGALGEAERHHREVLDLWPGDSTSLRDLGRVLTLAGREDEALAVFAERVRLHPDLPEARNDLGAALGRLGRPAQALVELRRAISLDPAYGEAHSNLAAALHELGRDREAREHLALASRHGFRPPEALVRRLEASSGR